MWMETAAMNFKDACSLEGKLWQTRQCVKKQRHYFVNKGLSSQSYGFPSSYVQMWELDLKESWEPKNWCLWIVLLEKILRIPWTARRLNQSIQKEINPEYSLEGLMLKLKLQYIGHLIKQPTHWKRPWCWEWLKSEGEKGSRAWDGWMVSPFQWTWTWANSGRCWGTGRPGML